MVGKGLSGLPPSSCVVVHRRMMIEKIASHIADFTPRLQSNTRATYQVTPLYTWLDTSRVAPPVCV